MLFYDQVVPQIMAVSSQVMGSHQQQQPQQQQSQQPQNTQGPTHIATLGQHQAPIMPQIQTQVVNQQHQLPLSITPVTYSTIQPQQIQQQTIQTVCLRLRSNVIQYVYVCFSHFRKV